ncbi:aminopeptidase [Anaerorhabdus furcosa]|uniref:Aminopeptidase n=1 Tax=Anaerorhabdus furcosa TaxID=118967 RepID=A0A1T4NXQ8_9FIRM|nr:aminopeptidase [Anaerorhabdus furcosa]SJZ83852.1 aminopeptidase [Anaerorhabdus furcosa]
MDNRLKKYAELAIKQGVNIQVGQPLVINAPVECVEFVRLCVAEAYKAKASKVDVVWSDDLITKLHYENVETDILKKVPAYKIEQRKEEVESKCAFLSIRSSIPGNLKHIDPSKLQAVSLEASKAMEPYRYYTMANVGQWSIVALPNVAWAETIFKDLKGEDAVNALWDAIFKSVRISEDNDPVHEWDNHNESLHQHNDLLNKYNFKSLHFKNGIGTDLVVGLVENHIWAGGYDTTQGGIMFNPNMPTEETFTTPLRTSVNGIVYGTKPLNYQGKLIENFWIKFKDGKAVEFHAEKQEDALANLINLDEGSCYLGEVALISHNSPISNMNILFYDTLFDENASCHLALGAAYPNNIKDGEKMSKEELIQHGCNVSMAHSDFMFGSADMDIVGITYDNQEIQLFKHGDFCI